MSNREILKKIAPHIRVIAFDMDGTLVDSISFLTSLVSKLFRYFGLKRTQLIPTVRKLAHISESAGRGWIERTLYAIHSVPLPFPLAFVFIFILGPLYWVLSPKHSKVYDISSLKSISSIKLALVTNGYPQSVYKFNLNGLFDIIITRKDVKLLKPRPEPYQLLIKKCKCKPEEILFVDDLECNIATARRMGMHTAGIRNIFNSIESLKKAGAEVVYENVELLTRDFLLVYNSPELR